MSQDPIVNNFAQRAFRDIADQDYIAARVSYRTNLWEPFLWSSQQAFEKVLKAILIYNNRSAKKLGHDLIKAYDRILAEIPEIQFSLPDDVLDFLQYINDIGTNRYFEFQTTIFRDALVLLDKSYWHIRRYCFNINSIIKRESGEVIDLLQGNLNRINNESLLTDPTKLKSIDVYDFLYKLSRRPSTTYDALVWQNLYFGKIQKKKVEYRTFVLTTIPPLNIHASAYGKLKDKVDFSRNIKDQFEGKPT